VVAGFFAAAGAHSGVLLSPVTLIATGAGIGARAFDGRCRQPGLGTKRPRGYRDGDAVPPQASIGVPAAITAVVVALAYDEQAKIARLLKAGIRRARDSGALARAELLERVRAVGASAVTESSFVRPFLHAAGEAAGGLVGLTDFRSIANVDCAASLIDEGRARWAVAPWALDESPVAADEDLGVGLAVCAVDVQGLAVALSYRRVMNGVGIDELEIEAPKSAVPVRRGVPRVAPGGSLPAPAPIAVRIDESGVPLEVVAAPAAGRLTPEVLATAKLRITWDSVARRAQVVGR
jgi:gamma-glutamyltranspeptidase/glutathione hydrolase